MQFYMNKAIKKAFGLTWSYQNGVEKEIISESLHDYRDRVVRNIRKEKQGQPRMPRKGLSPGWERWKTENSPLEETFNLTIIILIKLMPSGLSIGEH